MKTSHAWRVALHTRDGRHPRSVDPGEGPPWWWEAQAAAALCSEGAPGAAAGENRCRCQLLAVERFFGSRTPGCCSSALLYLDIGSCGRRKSLHACRPEGCGRQNRRRVRPAKGARGVFVMCRRFPGGAGGTEGCWWWCWRRQARGRRPSRHILRRPVRAGRFKT